MKKNIIIDCLFSSVVYIFISFVLLCTFSYKSDSSYIRFINYISDNISFTSEKNFSYCLEANGVNAPIVENKMMIDNRFYNYRCNVVPIIKTEYLSTDNTPLSFSYTSRYSISDSQHVNARLSFYGEDSSKLLDLDFYSNPYEKIARKNKEIVTLLIPYSFAKTYANSESIDVEDLMYSSILLDFNENYDFRVAGIWNDLIKAQDYQKVYNAFYSEHNSYVLFANDNADFLSDRKITFNLYALFGENKLQNINFFHMFCSSIGKTSGFTMPDFLINSWTVSDSFPHLYLLFNEYISSYSNKRLLFNSIAFGIILLILLVIGIFDFMNLCSDYENNKHMKWICSIMWPSCAIIGVLAFSMFKNYSFGFANLFTFSTIGLILLSLLTILLTAMSYFAFRNKNSVNCQNTINGHGQYNNFVGIVSLLDFNKPSAASLRLKGFVDFLTTKNFECIHIGFYKKDKNDERSFGTKLCKLKLINYIFLPFVHLYNLYDSYSEYKYTNMLIYSPLPVFTSLVTMAFARWHKINIIHDVHEYQNYSEMNLKRPGFFNISNHFYNMFLIGKNDSVISITNYLDIYVKRKGAKSVIVPPVFDKELIKIQKKNRNNQIKFLYLGDPGKKDNVLMCIEGFCKAFSELGSLENISVEMYGPKLSDYTDVLSQYDDYITSRFHFNKNVSRDEIPAIFEEASYTFLMRDPNKRFTKAGFPSKVVESLFFNTPIITNMTSDLNNYLVNKKTALIVDDYSSDCFKDVVLNAIKINDFYSKIFENNCRMLAENEFTMSKYDDLFLSLFHYDKISDGNKVVSSKLEKESK